VSVEDRVVTLRAGAMTSKAAPAMWCPSTCWIRIWTATPVGIAAHRSPLWRRHQLPPAAGDRSRHGGSRMAHALGYRVNVYHMNEGHAALLTLALLERQLGGGPLGAATEADMDQVRRKCVFTTPHACSCRPRPFLPRAVHPHSGRRSHARLEKLGCFRDGLLNMTLLSLRFSRYCNGVPCSTASLPRNVSGVPHRHITNGVHAPTWMSEPVQQLLDEHIPAWRRDNLYMRNAIDLPEAGSRQRTTAPSKPYSLKLPRAPAWCSTPMCSRWFCPPRSHLQARQPAFH